MGTLRFAGIFALNLLASVILAGATADVIIGRVGLPKSMWAAMTLESAIRALSALCLGYSAQALWPTREMKWLWTAGVLWLLAGIVRQSLQPKSIMDSYPYAALGVTTGETMTITTWSGFIVPFLQTLSYSAGAIWRSHRARLMALPLT